MRACQLLLLLGFSALLGGCAGSRFAAAPPAWAFWKLNRTNGHGLAVGRWRTFYDDAKHEPFTAGRYRRGRPVNTFRYYDPAGKLDYTETYGQDGHCEVKYWHPDGQLARRGPAQWVTGQGRPPPVLPVRHLDELRARRPDHRCANLPRRHHHPRRNLRTGPAHAGRVV